MGSDRPLYLRGFDMVVGHLVELSRECGYARKQNGGCDGWGACRKLYGGAISG